MRSGAYNCAFPGSRLSNKNKWPVPRGIHDLVGTFAIYLNINFANEGALILSKMPLGFRTIGTERLNIWPIIGWR